MQVSTHTLIWLFPVAFMLHDFEELIFLGPWLNKNLEDLRHRAPRFAANRLSRTAEQPAGQFALGVGLVFALTVLASFLAVEDLRYGFFLLASGMFFVHGFGHLAQALVLRRYIPAVVTSALLVIPYGLVLFMRLIAEGIVSWTGLLGYCALGAILVVPFILTVLWLGDQLYEGTVKLLLP